jgi:hypothetical protein
MSSGRPAAIQTSRAAGGAVVHDGSLPSPVGMNCYKATGRFCSVHTARFCTVHTARYKATGSFLHFRIWLEHYLEFVQ